MYKPLPPINSLADASALQSLLDWLEEVFKSFNLGKTATLNFDATSGKVSQIKIKDGIIYDYTVES